MQGATNRPIKRLLGRPLRAVADRLGYKIVRKSPIVKRDGYQLYQYRRPDGTFDRERYRQRERSSPITRSLVEQWPTRWPRGARRS